MGDFIYTCKFPTPESYVLFVISCLSICLCDKSKRNEQILIKFYMGRACLKKGVIKFWERSRSHSGYKKILNFWKHTLVEICTL